MEDKEQYPLLRFTERCPLIYFDEGRLHWTWPDLPWPPALKSRFYPLNDSIEAILQWVELSIKSVECLGCRTEGHISATGIDAVASEIVDDAYRLLDCIRLRFPEAPLAIPGATHTVRAAAQELQQISQWLRSHLSRRAAPRPRPDRYEVIAKAMLLLKDNPTWSDSQIAKAVGVHKSTLSRCKEYQHAKTMYRGEPPLGHRTVDSRGGAGVEAYDERFPETDDLD